MPSSSHSRPHESQTQWNLAGEQPGDAVPTGDQFLKYDFGRVTLRAADRKLAEFFFFLRSLIICGLVGLHCLGRPRPPDSHDLHADAIGEV